MTPGAYLLDFGGQCHVPGAAGPDAALDSMSLAAALAARQATDVRVLTDWHGAHAGVASVAAPTLEAAAARLEKQLREQGDIDEPAHVLVHQHVRRQGMVELVYTAVPMSVWQRYQTLADAAPRHVLWFDRVRVLRRWALVNGGASGTLVLAARDGFDVMHLAQGRIVGLQRVRCLHERAGNWREAARRVVAILCEQESRPDGLLLLQAPDSPAPLEELLAVLAPLRIGQAWSEAPATGAMNGARPQRIDWGALLARQPLWSAASPLLHKAATWAGRWVRPAGWGALSLSMLLAAGAGLTHYKAASVAAARQAQSGQAQSVWQELDAAVKQADRLAARQKDAAAWLHLRADNAALPDFFTVLLQLRVCLPEGMLIEEVGLVADKGEHVITVVGQAATLEGSLRDESAFVEALHNQGFRVLKRDMVAGAGQQKFKLSMTWSEA